jgi:hypothetical protein
MPNWLSAPEYQVEVSKGLAWDCVSVGMNIKKGEDGQKPSSFLLTL